VTFVIGKLHADCLAVAALSGTSATTRARIVGTRARNRSRVGDEARKTFVHVIPMMALDKRRTGIVGNEIDLGPRETRHADGVFHESRQDLLATFCHFEGVPVQMHRMLVAAVIVHDETIALAALPP
jgi:hypothetical protein